jgi:hypothetical protein
MLYCFCYCCQLLQIPPDSYPASDSGEDEEELDKRTTGKLPLKTSFQE